jgi:hypothetical protein
MRGAAIALILSGSALLLAPPASADAPGSFTVPDYGRFMGTWLWIKTEGATAVSDPETKGASRTLVLKPDLTYELHQRRDTRDSLLCRGNFLFSEESGAEGTQDFVQFEGWFETYERRMSVEFNGPDTLLLVGDACENCPEHTYVRGRSAVFGGEVARGARFKHDLWDGLRLELDPMDLGWEIVVRDTTRPKENLTRLTPPFHSVPNPRVIQGWHFRNKANTGPNRGDVNAPGTARDFIFSRQVGRSIQGPDADHDVTEEEVERVGHEGRGVLTIEDMKIGAAGPGERAGIESMRFTVAIEEVGAASKRARP